MNRKNIEQKVCENCLIKYRVIECNFRILFLCFFLFVVTIINSILKSFVSIAKVTFSIDNTFLNFKNEKTRTKMFVRNRANDTLTIVFFSQRKFNKRYRFFTSLLLILKTKLLRKRFSKAISSTSQVIILRKFLTSHFLYFKTRMRTKIQILNNLTTINYKISNSTTSFSRKLFRSSRKKLKFKLTFRKTCLRIKLQVHNKLQL